MHIQTQTVFKQVAQLWQRDRAKLDTFAINVQVYSQTHAQYCILGQPMGVSLVLQPLYSNVLTQETL